MEEEQELIPVEQKTILFYGKPLVVVRLPDGRPGVVIRFFCENLQIDTAAQVARIRRTEAIVEDLAFARVETDGGSQKMAVLVLHAVAFWLAGIDPKRVRDEVKADVLRYQREVVDVLYAWAQAPKAITAPQQLVPAEPITKPTPPAEEASLDEWREYHRQMVLWIDWQHDIEQWRGSVESRIESLEEVTSIILEQLGPQTLTPEHQRVVQHYTKQLHEATGKPYGTIYDSLKTAFSVPRYQDIPEAEWDKVENWFKVQIERGRKK